MSDQPKHRRRLLALGSAVILALAAVTPALAWQAEGGTKYCPGVGFVHFKYNDIADVVPPGSSILYMYRENDGNWHEHERNGVSGGGNWEVDADPWINLDLTYPGCRNYG